ncbi:MAG: lactate utilization protein [Candidatus Njordarchaeia archaeon]
MRSIEEILEDIKSNEKYIQKLRDFVSKFQKKISTIDRTELEQNLEIIQNARTEFLSKPEKYMDQACENIELNHGECYYANDAQEALEIILTIIGREKDVILYNGPESREINLPQKLRENNVNVYFSKISDLIGDIIGLQFPSEHNIKFYEDEYIMEKLSKYFNKEFKNFDDMLEDLKNYLKDIFNRVEVGISTADAIAADTGSIFLVDIEGDIRRVSVAPRSHILLVGLEKIYPTFLDAWVATYLKFHLSIMRKPTSINIISGPSKTADIEKVVTYGVHGPTKLFVILLNNNRKNMLLDPEFSKILNCLECNGCLFRSPLLTAFTGNIGYPVENAKELYLRLINNDPSLQNEKIRGLLGYIFDKGKPFGCPVEIELDRISKNFGLDYSNLDENLLRKVEELMSSLGD